MSETCPLVSNTTPLMNPPLPEPVSVNITSPPKSFFLTTILLMLMLLVTNHNVMRHGLVDQLLHRMIDS